MIAFWNTNRTDWLWGTTFAAPRSPGWTIDDQPSRTPALSLRRRLGHLPFLPFHYPLPHLTTPILSRLLQPALERVIPEGAEIIHHIRIGREILAHASLAIARRRGIPFVLTPLHHPRWTGWRYREWIRIYREADLVFALSEVEKTTLVGLGVEEDRIRVIGHAPSVHPTESRPQDKETPTVLFLGQHYDYKGWRSLLEAAPLVWATRPDVRFVFAGPPVGSSERAFVHTDPRIIRMGKVDETTKAKLLAECSMLVLPSTQESFGGVFTEAWTFGKPVVGCPIPAVSELIEHEVDGLLANQDPRDLAQAILRLLDDPTGAGRMGAAGREKVQNRFTWPAIAEKVERGYRDAIAKLRARP